MSTKRHTQAVIVIHGVGEQLPMGTIRGFVNAVLKKDQKHDVKFFSRPDNISDTFELRILQNRKQPRTHFVEYYWAYKVEGTKLGHIVSWLKALLLRWPGKVTKQLLPLWIISWSLILAIGIGFILGRIEPDFYKLSGASAAIFSIVQGFILNWIGDAARYLSPSPQNIKMRQKIRADGINLIKKIHETGEYDRIIIVGHSLGTVIGYDIMKHLWNEYNEVYKNPREEWQKKSGEERQNISKKELQPALLRVEELGEKLGNDSTGKTLNDYMNAQEKLWQELRSMGNPWLITDFITLGTPLTHAAMLLAKNADDLEERQKQRELPTNPPITELCKEHGKAIPCYSYKWDPYHYGKNQEFKFTPWVIHHAGLFACTRWTNLYFPAKLGLFGDFVGGPLQTWFGPGIKDIQVRTGNIFRDLTLLAHNSYWHKSKNEAKNKKYLQLLIDALDLDNKEILNF